jgi:diguanylate cyclase (GGDEF)-like protein
MTNLGYLLAFGVYIVFSFTHIFIYNNFVAGLLEFIFIIPALYGFFKLRSDKNIKKGAMRASYLLFVTISIVLFLFQFKECIVAWALLFPFVAMNLCGAEKGLRLIVVFNIIVYIGAYYFWSDSHISIISYIRFLTVSMITSTLVYFYEKSIESSFEKQSQLNASLIASVEEARELAIRDALTGLYNKRHFDTVFSEEFNRAKRAEEPFILAIIDVDNFKAYNDTYGHDSGNFALERVGKILTQQTLRSGDYAFRIGGEEFAVILQSCSSKNTYNHLDDLRQKIEDEKIEHINNPPYGILTVSIGVISIAHYEATTMIDAYRLADKNLYAIKHNGKNKVKLTAI